MALMSIAPWQLGLPHSAWRIYQFEAVVDARAALEQKDGVIMEAPVGIGKTAIAGALSDGIS